ncbi:D-glycero-beta-D-manno-heptose 1-phosphate adenylyltransferase [bacterium]|nr:D-glycero-beta-D-manno-heptose 1-phosphate adenylyltransferase [bacterium]
MLSADETGLLESARASGKTIVFTNGCFDLLHPGHIHQLREAKAQGDFLIVGLNSDASTRRLKGEGRPVLPQDARRELLEAIRYVDAVVVFDGDTPEELIREVRPDVLVKGAEYETKDIVGAGFVEGYGGRVHRVAMLPGYSTSELLAKLR